MGTNYYLRTKDNIIAGLIGDFTTRADDPTEYEIHLGKRSGGWLPLLQAHPGIRSVKELESFCKFCTTRIYDEYNRELSWPQLKEELIEWNGGFDGAIAKTKVEQDTSMPFYDPDMPDYVPVSHFEYGKGKAWLKHYFKDPDGWEFCEQEFS